MHHPNGDRVCSDGSFEKECAATKGLIVESDHSLMVGAPPIVLGQYEPEASEPKRLRVQLDSMANITLIQLACLHCSSALGCMRVSLLYLCSKHRPMQ